MAASPLSLSSIELTSLALQRYFILKAHDVFSLEESIRTGLWSTQGHNEVSPSFFSSSARADWYLDSL